MLKRSLAEFSLEKIIQPGEKRRDILKEAKYP